MGPPQKKEFFERIINNIIFKCKYCFFFRETANKTKYIYVIENWTELLSNTIV